VGADRNNCGACGVVCATGQSCSDGQCVQRGGDNMGGAPEDAQTE
jgi:hypothetical protein